MNYCWPIVCSEAIGLKQTKYSMKDSVNSCETLCRGIPLKKHNLEDARKLWLGTAATMGRQRGKETLFSPGNVAVAGTTGGFRLFAVQRCLEGWRENLSLL